MATGTRKPQKNSKRSSAPSSSEAVLSKTPASARHLGVTKSFPTQLAKADLESESKLDGGGRGNGLISAILGIVLILALAYVALVALQRDTKGLEMKIGVFIFATK